MRISLLFLLFTIGAAHASPAQDLPWRQYQGGIDHRGHLPISFGASDLELAWELQLGNGRSIGTAVLDNNRAYVTVSGGANQGVYAIELFDGQIAWQQLYGFADGTSSPSLDRGDSIYFQSYDGPINSWLRGISAHDGSPITLLPIDDVPDDFLSPTIDRGLVHVAGGEDGGMYEFIPLSRTESWFYDLAGRDSQWTPAVDPFLGAYAYTGGRIACVELQTGAVLFDEADPGYISGVNRLYQAPVLGDRGNVIVTNNGRLVSFDKTTGLIDWEVLEFFSGQASLHNGEIWVANAGSLDVRSEVDGSLLWRYIPANGAIRGPIVLTDAHAFFSDEDETFALNRQSLQVEWTYPADGRISIGEGYLMIAQDNGVITAIRHNKLPTPESVNPERLNFYTGAGTIITVEGEGFDVQENTNVTIGGRSATHVRVIDSETLTCKLPTLPPGRFDLVVSDSSGSGTLALGFASTPALRVEGNFELGETVSVIVDSQPNDDIFLFYDFGAPYTVGQAMPPYLGERFLKTPTLLLTQLAWPWDEFSRNFQLPDKPSFSGKSVAVQALVGPSVSNQQAAFSNHFVVQVQ